MAYLVDTHVHWHPSFEADSFLTGMADNLARLSTNTDAAPELAVFLASINASNGLADVVQQLRHTPWTVVSDESYRVTASNAGRRISLFHAAQVVSAEGLELIAVGPLCAVPEKLPFTQYIERFETTHLLIAPWGFGKWLGQRRTTLKLALKNYAGRFLLGDSRLRPRLFREPLFAGDRNNAPVSGTDPLPMANQLSVAGQLASLVDVDQATPDGLLTAENWLNARTVGARLALLPAIYTQLALRMS